MAVGTYYRAYARTLVAKEASLTLHTQKIGLKYPGGNLKPNASTEVQRVFEIEIVYPPPLRACLLSVYSFFSLLILILVNEFIYGKSNVIYSNELIKEYLSH